MEAAFPTFIAQNQMTQSDREACRHFATEFFKLEHKLLTCNELKDLLLIQDLENTSRFALTELQRARIEAICEDM